jgi:pimeloyl-ACP methyl ester carboxylesterase
MSRLQTSLAVAGAILTALGAVWITRSEPPQHQIVVEIAGCHTPTTILEPPSVGAPPTEAGAAAILLHGLSANRRVMKYLGAAFAGHGFRVFIPDLPGHGDNTDPFSFARAEECAQATIASLMHGEHLDPAKTVVVGHSMGGAFAVRLADQIPVAATIALSPAPMVAPHRMPANLLVFSAQFDLWPLSEQATALKRAAGGERTAPEDFRQQRAFELDRVPLASHTSLLDDERVMQREEQWADQALAFNASLGAGKGTRTSAGLGYGSLLGIVGLGLMVPLWTSLAARLGGPPIVDHHIPTSPSHLLLLAEGAVCALASVALLAAGVPLRFVQVYSGDYLASALLILGLLMLVLNRAFVRDQARASLHQLLAAAALGFTLIFAFGAWLNWQATDLWPNGARWLRFAELLPFLFLFSFSEEVFLGPVRAGKPRALRFGLFLAIRAVLWLAIVLAYFELSNGQVVLPVLVLPFAAFSVAQRLVADALGTRTGSATGAAVFDAILAAWFVAAVFPIT